MPVCIEAHDRAALERLLRYCARPPFLPWSACADRKQVDLPLRQAAQRTLPATGAVPRQTSCTSHRWNSSTALPPWYRATHPLQRLLLWRCWRPVAARDVVTAMATAPAQVAAVPADPATMGTAAHKAPRSVAMAMASRRQPRTTTQTASALPLGGADCAHLRGVSALFRLCGGQMRIIAFITHSAKLAHPGPHRGRF